MSRPCAWCGRALAFLAATSDFLFAHMVDCFNDMMSSPAGGGRIADRDSRTGQQAEADRLRREIAETDRKVLRHNRIGLLLLAVLGATAGSMVLVDLFLRTSGG